MYALIDISNQMLEDSAFDHAGASLGKTGLALAINEMLRRRSTFGGDWTEEKLFCLEKYLNAYRAIFTRLLTVASSRMRTQTRCCVAGVWSATGKEIARLFSLTPTAPKVTGTSCSGKRALAAAPDDDDLRRSSACSKRSSGHTTYRSWRLIPSPRRLPSPRATAHSAARNRT